MGTKTAIYLRDPFSRSKEVYFALKSNQCNEDECKGVLAFTITDNALAVFKCLQVFLETLQKCDH